MKDTSWHSYPKVFAIGHGAVKELFDDEVIVEEKVDGSQFSFGIFDGVLRFKSKSVELDPSNPEKMFIAAIESVTARRELLTDGYTYRGEYLRSPQHNTLKYDSIPKDHIIIFDINTGNEQYLSYEDKVAEAERIGYSVVPILSKGKITMMESLLALMETTSCLGGTKIEGFVVKNYNKFGSDKKCLMGKYVSEGFKEANHEKWKGNSTSKVSVEDRLVAVFKTEARWDKAIQHLREKGLLTDSPKDIGNLIKEIREDSKFELEEQIKDLLFKEYWSILERRLVGGFPEYYKTKLMENAFKDK